MPQSSRWEKYAEPSASRWDRYATAKADATQQPTFPPQPDNTLSRFVQNFGVGMQHPLQAGIAGLANALPPIGAMVGSLAGPVGTAGGTMAGELLNQDVRDMLGMEHSSPMDKIKQAAVSGALSGGLDAGLAGLGKLASPERIYGSALKPSTTLSPNVRSSMISKALNDAIPVGTSGYEKSAAEIKTLAGQINQQVSQATKSGIKYDLPMIIEPKIAALRSSSSVQSDPAAYRNAVDNFETSFLNRPNPISPDDMMKIKRNLGKELQPYFQGFKKSSPAPEQRADAIKATGYFATRDYLEKRFPELAGLNENTSEKILLHDAIARATNRINNRELVGLPEIGTTTATAAATENPMSAMAAFIAHKVLMNPAVTSRLAIALAKARPLGQAMKFALPATTAIGQSALQK